MKKFLLVIGCLLLIGCSQEKTRGLKMEINLDSENLGIWRCFSNNQDIIKITEENYIEDRNNEMNGTYQFRFVGVKAGDGEVTCNYLMESEIVNTGIYYVKVNNSQIIEFLEKSGDIKIVDPILK